MPRRATPSSEPWADEVAFIELRSADDRDLERISEENALGLTAPEMRRVRAQYRRLNRDPTDVELAGIAQSWSEHCSYKSSKRTLKACFRGLVPRSKVLGTGDAGVVRFSPGLAYALRIESHNHPSAVEPYGGAATGIGGILRDVLAVGAKPVALADPLFFGPLDGRADPPGGPLSRSLFRGVVSGIRDYGNRVGVPTVTGSVGFDPSYAANPLVNVGCVGILPAKRLRPNRAERAGDRAVLVGGRTGRDGIGGVAFASKELTERSSTESRGNVQLGDPIMKEPLIRACLAAYDAGLVRGVKDLGGGGLATAAGELADAGGLGLDIDLGRVPLRESAMRPWEIWISESQERMILDVRPRDVPPLLDVFREHDVPATDLGRFVAGGMETVRFHGRIAANAPLAFRVDPPLLNRKGRRRPPISSGGLQVPDTDLPGLFESLVLAPDSLSREPIIRLYDHEVQGRTVVKPLHGRPGSPSHGDAAVLRPSARSANGLAVTVASQPWSCSIDPRRGGIWTVEEAARNLYAVGARPDAFTDCLNFGNPEDPSVFGDFQEVVKGLSEGARSFGFAVPSGNVSFYNGSPSSGILPTPVLMATGLVPDLRRSVTSDLKEVGDPIFLVGESRPSLGGSLYARLHAVPGGEVPTARARTTRRLGELLLRAGQKGWVRAAHDVSDGGLATTLFEMAAGGREGASVDLSATGLAGAGIALAAEGGSRWVVEVRADDARPFERSFGRLPVRRLGLVGGDGIRLSWGERALASISLGELDDRWRAGIPP